MLVWFCEGAIGQHRCGQPSAHPEEGAIVNGAAEQKGVLAVVGWDKLGKPCGREGMLAFNPS